METSAKTAMNVNDIFLAIGKCGYSSNQFCNFILHMEIPDLKTMKCSNPI